MHDLWKSRQSLTWAGYDVASSVYIGVAPAVLLPIYFQHLLAGFKDPTAAWGGLAALAVLVSSVLALGAAAATARISRFTLLTCLTAAMVAAIAALAWNPGSSILHAAVAYVAAQSFYFAATAIYESYLPDLLPPDDRQRLSGFGWAVGYLGGLFVIIVLLVLIAAQPSSPQLIEQCLGVVALISAVFFTIVLSLMWRAGFARIGGSSAPRMGGVFGALRHWRANPAVFRLLLGSMLVQMAIFIVVTFTAPILATRFGQSLQDLLWLLLLIHVLSVPTTLAWSHLMIARRRLVPMSILLASWAVVLLLLAYGSGPWMPLVTVTVIGCCLGATASAIRGFLAESVGAENPAALFALSTVAGRLAAAFGPALFSVVALAAGQRAALMIALVVLACGSALIMLFLQGQPAVQGRAA